MTPRPISQTDAATRLRLVLPPGATVTVIVKHRSRSGHPRRYLLFADGSNVTLDVAALLGKQTHVEPPYVVRGHDTPENGRTTLVGSWPHRLVRDLSYVLHGRDCLKAVVL